MIVSIHQPNFMPWLPYFQKVSDADIFVILGHCQFEKNNFQNRFAIDGKWQTLRVKKGNDPIIEKKYVNAVEDWDSIKKKLPEHKSNLDEMDYCVSDNLLDTNTKIIKHICGKFGIKTKIEKDFKTSSRKTERLLEICQHYKATQYLSGPSGKNYLNTDLFKNAGIGILYPDNSAEIKRPILECLTK